MLAIQILSTKQFMSELLTGDIFNSFLLESASVTTFNTFSIDGRIHPDFFSKEDEDYEEKIKYTFSPYNLLKNHLFSYIKGNNTPLQIKMTLLLKPEAVKKLLLDGSFTAEPEFISDFVLNIKYDGAKILLTTAISYTGFTPDKSAEPIWDNAMKKFLEKNNLSYDEV